MIISHKHQFIFFKTEKTAGTSFEIALSKYCGEQDIITPITPNDEQVRKELGYRSQQNYFIPFRQYTKLDWVKLLIKRRRLCLYNHITAEEVRSYIDPQIWNSYFKFCFERNPWDKVISHYHWVNHFSHKNYNSISEFIQSGEAGKMRGFEVYTIGGIPVVDKIYKYEELPSALADISRRIGLNEKIEMPIYKAKGDVRKDKRPYTEVLSKEEKETISKIFAREIAWLGY
jgi:hypothetical protein